MTNTWQDCTWRPLTLLGLALAVGSSSVMSAAEPAWDGVRLELRFDPTIELAGVFTNYLKQDMTTAGGETMHHEMMLTGTTRQVAVDFDGRSGQALVGLLGSGEWSILAGTHGLDAKSRSQVWAAAYRVDRAGNAVRRDFSRTAPNRHELRRNIGQICETLQVCAAFPSNGVAVGQEWAGPVLLPTPGTRQPGWAVSKLESVEEKAGRRQAVIGSGISSGGELSYDTWRRDLGRPDMALRGTSRCVLDLDLGAWQSVRLDLDADVEGKDFRGQIHLTSDIRLTATRKLPVSAVAEFVARTRALDEAMVKLCLDEPDAALRILRDSAAMKKDGMWARGMKVTADLVEQALNPAPPVGAKGHGPPPQTSPDGKLLQQGDEAAHAGKWEQALEFYETLTRKYPDGDPALQALSASAAIYEAKLGRKDKAEVLRQELVRRREQRVAKGSGRGVDWAALYKQAGELAAAGQTDKAVEAYQRFLAQPAEGVAPGRRLLAQYRLAGLLEKAGQKENAAAAYRAVLELPGDDEYAVSLKGKARENEERLGMAEGRKGGE